MALSFMHLDDRSPLFEMNIIVTPIGGGVEREPRRLCSDGDGQLSVSTRDGRLRGQGPVKSVKGAVAAREPIELHATGAVRFTAGLDFMGDNPFSGGRAPFPFVVHDENVEVSHSSARFTADGDLPTIRITPKSRNLTVRLTHPGCGHRRDAQALGRSQRGLRGSHVA